MRTRTAIGATALPTPIPTPTGMVEQHERPDVRREGACDAHRRRWSRARTSWRRACRPAQRGRPPGARTGPCRAPGSSPSRPCDGVCRVEVALDARDQRGLRPRSGAAARAQPGTARTAGRARAEALEHPVAGVRALSRRGGGQRSDQRLRASLAYSSTCRRASPRPGGSRPSPERMTSTIADVRLGDGDRIGHRPVDREREHRLDAERGPALRQRGIPRRSRGSGGGTRGRAGSGLARSPERAAARISSSAASSWDDVTGELAAGHDAPRGRRAQQAHPVDVEHVLAAELPHPRRAERLRFDEPQQREVAQRLAHGRLARAELLRDAGLYEWRPRARARRG